MRFWHVEMNLSGRGFGLFIALAAGFGIASAAFLPTIGGGPYFSGFSIIIAMVVAESVSQRRINLALERAFELTRDVDEIERTAVAVLQSQRLPFGVPLFGALGSSEPKLLARRFVTSGGAGRCYWISSAQAEAPRLEPFTERFEPILLARGARPPESAQAHPPTVTDHMRRFWREMDGRVSSRSLRILLVLGLIGAIMSLGGQLVETAVALWQGTMPMNLAMWVFPIAALAAIVAWRLFRPRNCFAVPGALVVRSAGGHETTWRLRLFARPDSVVIYWRERGLLAVVARDGAVIQTMMRQPEAEIAVRAWLSPIAPPPIEQLSDLR
ncbi:MAG: hypothetical protein IT450_22105 [Phycisphaerales bacterium]|nr:hypothetical protein [Phycisphaerales bacterium]